MDKRLRNALKGLAAPDPDSRRRAMEPFVRLTFGMFIRHLHRYLGNEVECEDVLEDVYADIWENPDHLRDVENERHLLRTVYLYYMRKRLREVYRRMNRSLYLSQKDMQNLVAPELGLCELMSQAELKQILHRMLGKLKARERKAIELWMLAEDVGRLHRRRLIVFFLTGAVCNGECESRSSGVIGRLRGGAA